MQFLWDKMNICTTDSCSYVPGMWEQYVEWFVKQLGTHSLLPAITLRAVRNCRWSSQLCSHHVMALQQCCCEDDIETLDKEIKGASRRYYETSRYDIQLGY